MRGEELDPELVRLAYSQGAFPMGNPETGEIEFYVPRRRALFPISGLRVSRSLGKVLRSGVFEIRFDTVFQQVIRGCLRPDDNWITEDIVRVYSEIHRQGWAHSSEAWKGGELVGGVYGLALGSCFCPESMFHREANASKVALWALVERCRELGLTLFDAQIMNPHLASLGAFETTHEEYLAELEPAMRRKTDWDLYSG